MDMEFGKLVEGIMIEKRRVLSDKLIDLILSSKNDDKMPSQLANTILNHWKRGVLSTQPGLTALLEAGVTLEPEKTVSALIELQLTRVAERLKIASPKA